MSNDALEVLAAILDEYKAKEKNESSIKEERSTAI